MKQHFIVNIGFWDTMPFRGRVRPYEIACTKQMMLQEIDQEILPLEQVEGVTCGNCERTRVYKQAVREQRERA